MCAASGEEGQATAGGCGCCSSAAGCKRSPAAAPPSSQMLPSCCHIAVTAGIAAPCHLLLLLPPGAAGGLTSGSGMHSSSCCSRQPWGSETLGQPCRPCAPSPCAGPPRPSSGTASAGEAGGWLSGRGVGELGMKVALGVVVGPGLCTAGFTVGWMPDAAGSLPPCQAPFAACWHCHRLSHHLCS
jgi:hypothetical protein